MVKIKNLKKTNNTFSKWLEVPHNFLGIHGHIWQCSTRESKFEDFLIIPTLLDIQKKTIHYIRFKTLLIKTFLNLIDQENLKPKHKEDYHSNFMTNLGWNFAEVAILTQIWFSTSKT